VLICIQPVMPSQPVHLAKIKLSTERLCEMIQAREAAQERRSAMLDGEWT
jgi:hypothetical protein